MRKMATIRRIDELNPIDGADKIEVATIGGWKVVCQKGLYNVGDLAIYCEIDSWIPSRVAPFLTRDGHYPKVFNEVEGERLKTIKLRGQISQGLLLPMSVLTNYGADLVEGDDVSETLGIVKYEPPIPAQLAGEVRGNFPSQIPKTDQERVQNLKKEIDENHIRVFEVTEKLDGSSMTCYLIDGVFGVCSRNLDLKESETNTFWKVAREQNIEGKMRLVGDNFAIQGELIGEGIQKNPYGIKGQDFYVFDIYNIKDGSYVQPEHRQRLCAKYAFKHCPIIMTDGMIFSGEGDTVGRLLREAEGKSILNPKTEREGLVFKSTSDEFTFKVISNLFLLKGGE